MRALSGTNIRRALAGALLATSVQATPAGAIDLLKSYELALANDGQLKVAKARADAGREALPQATALLLPNLTFSYAYGQTNQDKSLDGVTTPTQNFPSKSAGLVLRQPIYRKNLFSQYDEAKSKVVGVEAQLDKDFQGMGVRLASAYFDALFAGDSLDLIGAQKASYAAQLRAATLAVKAGTGTRTDVDETQARLDLLLAEEIRARQAINSTVEQLEIFVGEPIKSLSTLDPASFRADAFDPIALDGWVTRAYEYNPDLRAQKARLEAALSGIGIASAGHHPSVDLVAQYNNVTGDGTNIFPRTETKSTYVGVQLNVPIFSGGYVNSTVRQATAAAEEAREMYEYLRVDLRLKVKQAFDSLKAGISRVSALETALTSAEQVVLSNRKGVLAGTRTNLDVLNVEQQRFNTKVDLAKARYQLLVAWATLQGYVGDLNVDQIRRINRSLKEPLPVAMVSR